MARIGKHEKGNLKMWCVFWGREERVLGGRRGCWQRADVVAASHFPRELNCSFRKVSTSLDKCVMQKKGSPFWGECAHICSSRGMRKYSRLKESKPALPLFLEAVPMVTVSFATGRIQEQKSTTQSAIFQWANKNPILRMLFLQVFITLFLTSLNIIGREGTWAMGPCLLSVIPLHMWLTLGSWLTIFG